jgi:hypothetical protein
MIHQEDWADKVHRQRGERSAESSGSNAMPGAPQQCIYRYNGRVALAETV